MVAVGFGGTEASSRYPTGGFLAVLREALHGRGGEAVRQLALITVLYFCYRAGRLLTADETGRAFDNAEGVLDLEHGLGLRSETAVQSLFVDHQWLAVSANFYYATAHFTVAVAVLLWLWTFRPHHYRWTRNVMVAATGAALLVHVLVPLAPPRMLPEHGFIDLAAIHGQSVYGPVGADGLSNQFAAMPSLHVGWALLLAVALVAATEGAWRWIFLIHPTLTLLVVVGTGNHYWLDAVVAVGLLGTAALLHPTVSIPHTERPIGSRKWRTNVE
ncbi:phosphatase PAP2 family protein [Nocardia bovistercoris]|uniref:Phosphatase PAP2 family protein n=1 Tax=Nocardia bovistercoris TaxID=2785916 RepID=A0A931I714_9NOCA|nr:phosphatase PAP2 family protein [Nocardia bovistercoris]MBH0775809.1 phosphatase PAP2 family protein [Nocardia bovistercoris]